MEEVANFLRDLLRGLDLIALSMAVGGVVWGLLGLRAWRHPAEVARVVVERCVTLLYAGAVGVALAQLMRPLCS